MPRSNATSVGDYLAMLPPDRRKVISAVRKMILRHLPKGYEEGMNWLYHLLRDGFKKAGKKLDMGKSCLGFRALEDVPGMLSATLLQVHPRTR